MNNQQSPANESTKRFFSSPEPTELRNLIHQAAIDSLRSRGYVAAPLTEQMFPVEVAIKHLDLYTTDIDELDRMLLELQTERSAALMRIENGDPHPLRADEVPTISPKKCMDILLGLIFWAAGMDEDGLGCMTNAGELIAELYGQWDEDAA